MAFQGAVGQCGLASGGYRADSEACGIFAEEGEKAGFGRWKDQLNIRYRHSRQFEFPRTDGIFRVKMQQNADFLRDAKQRL